MNSRLIAPMVAFVCLLSVAAEPAQIAGRIQVSEGPTPFISFVNTTVTDVVGLTIAEFIPRQDRRRSGRSVEALASHPTDAGLTRD